MASDNIEEYRERFRHAPHGVWSTCADRPAEQIIRFFENRRGVCHIAARLGGGIIHFEWQPHEEGCLRLRRIDPRTGLAKDAGDWLFFRYKFQYVALDNGDVVAMRTLEFGRLESFNEPLYFHGEAKEDHDLIEEEPGPRAETVSEHLHGRFLIALFISLLFVGLGLAVAGEMQVQVDPLVYVFSGIGLFVLLYLWMSLPTRPRPAPEDEYHRETE